MNFQKRIDAIWPRISSEDFLENRGGINEKRYYIFEYDPVNETVMRSTIQDLKEKNNPDTDGFVICEYDIYDMVIDILEEKGYIDKCIRFEKEKGFPYVEKAVKKTLRLTTDQNMIINRIVKETPDNAVVFLTGIGKVYPFVRAHNLLNTLRDVFHKCPVVMFYPGKWDGQTLSLFGTMTDGNYYMAKPLVYSEGGKTR